MVYNFVYFRSVETGIDRTEKNQEFSEDETSTDNSSESEAEDLTESIKKLSSALPIKGMNNQMEIVT